MIHNGDLIHRPSQCHHHTMTMMIGMMNRIMIRKWHHHCHDDDDEWEDDYDDDGLLQRVKILLNILSNQIEDHYLEECDL